MAGGGSVSPAVHLSGRARREAGKRRCRSPRGIKSARARGIGSGAAGGCSPVQRAASHRSRCHSGSLRGMHSYLEEEHVLRPGEGAESIPIPEMIAFEAKRWNWKWLLANLK